MFDVDGQPVGEAPAGGAVLPVVSAAKNTRPVGSEWNFTGTTAGSNLWVLPKTKQNGILFLGIGAEEISSNDLAGSITLTFQSLSGPSGGVFSMWDFGTFGGLTPLVTSAWGFNLTNTLTIAAGGHTHFNYGFTAPGLYDVTFEATATLASSLGGGQVGGTGTFRFGVFDTGSPYPEPDPMAGPYVFLGNTFDNYIYGDGHVDLGVALAPVPEPSSIALAGLGVAGLAGVALRRRMRKR
ncbi:MAG: choice-of-anchor M domain-containing protein [Planctomycetota bacterium]